MAKLICVAAIGWLVAGPSLNARAEIRSTGEIGVEGRAFWPDDDPRTEDWGAALWARLELKNKHRPWREQLRVLGRVGGVDQSRSVIIVEEGYLGWKNKWLRLRLGPQLLNWTATEAFHPADIINSRNFDSNVENADKIGEPMFSVSMRLGAGRLEAFYMPFRMDPLLPAPSQRLSFAPSDTNFGDPLWIGRDGEVSDGVVEHQWAARLSQTFGDADVAIQVVQHQDRSQPTVVLDPDDTSARPLYHMVTHYGLTYTQVVDSSILKLEAAHRRFKAPKSLDRFIPLTTRVQRDHTQIALGFETGWDYGSGADGTWILEGQGVFGGDTDERQALSPFQADILVGYRHAFNDIDSKEILLTAIFDVENGEVLASASYKQRLSDTWTFATNVRAVSAPPEPGVLATTGLQGLHKSHLLQLSLTRHF